MNVRPALSPRTSQALRLTPAMRQGLSLLRMPAADLVTEVNRLAAENPMISLDEPAGRGWGGAESLVAPEPLGERLCRQIAEMPLDPVVAAIARFLIGDIDEAGYLDPDAARNAESLGAAPDQVEAAIAAVQACEPAGVGARGLEECLALQMRERGVPESTARTVCAHLGLLSEARFDALATATGLALDKLRPLAEMLPQLTPRPGDSMSGAPLPPLPEILVEDGPDGLLVAVTDSRVLPQVELDTALVTALEGRQAQEMRQQAEALVRALEFRARTLGALARLIVAHQYRFFADGPDHLVPMTRAALARALDLHPSTVGRALAGKALSYRGCVHPLSRFVSPPLSGGNGPVTAYAVQRRIRRLVEAETVGRELSDEEIAAELRREGVDIARRTVAKYRRCLSIPSSFERRRRKAARHETRPEPR